MNVEVVVTETTVVVDPEIGEVAALDFDVVEVPVVALDLGPAGPPGPTGPQGPPGPGGAGSAFVWDQQAAATVWTVTHGFNGYPNVSTFDTLGRQLEGDVAYLSTSSLTVTFSVPVAGTAYLS